MEQTKEINNYSKIKNLIFDLDNTIILNEEKDVELYKEALEKLGYDTKDYLKVFNCIDDYEKSITEEELYYSKENMIKYINFNLKKNYSIKLIDELSDIVAKKWINKVLLQEETVKYLYSKYNLYVYTNFFQEQQYKRIQNIGYDKYFKGVFGADIYGCKPHKKGLENVLKKINALPEECLMIGDSKLKEVRLANSVGMQAILLDFDGKRDDKNIYANNYIVVRNLKKLEEIL